MRGVAADLSDAADDPFRSNASRNGELLETIGDYDYRWGSEEHFDGSSALWQGIFPDYSKARLRRRWVWRTETCRWILAVHRPSGEVGGVIGDRPLRLAIGERVLSGHGMADWYVAPSHAGRGIGKHLVRLLGQDGRPVVLLQMSDVAMANLHRMGYHGPRRVPIHLLPAPAVAKRRRCWPAAAGLTFETFLSGRALRTEAIDELWKGSKWSSPRMVRDGAELNFRLGALSSRGYQLVVATRGGLTVGYVLCRTLQRAVTPRVIPGKVQLVVDILAKDDDVEVMAALLRQALDPAATATMVMTTSTALGNLLPRLGAISENIRPVRRLTGRLGASFMAVGVAPDDMESWYLTIADADWDFAMGAIDD